MSDGYHVYIPRLLAERDEPDAAGWWQVEGTLMFADVSGFTRLSEKLARQGKIGAEELVLIISRVFTEMLESNDVALDLGGDVLKFGGDALLILFTGDRHESRAARAALHMQRRLRDVGSVETSAGRVRLRMSVGMASGTVSLFVVGEEHLELLALGPVASETVAVETVAEAGQILVGHRTAAALPPGVLGDRVDAGVFLKRAPTAKGGAGSGAAHDRQGLDTYVPLLLRDRIGARAAAYDHEHRMATVAFLHLAGVDKVLEDEGPEAAFGLLQQAACVIERATREQRVLIVCTDLAPDGTKYMMATGTPDAGEDDEARMLVAARTIVDQIQGLSVRIGINRGRVFAGDVGAPLRRTYSTMGDPVNLAARIMGKTPWGGVLAHADVIAQASGRVVSTPLEPFMVKGKSLPVHAESVDAVVTSRPISAQSTVPFCGRQSELTALLDAADAATTGTGQVIELAGEAGIGKTRLLAELSQRRPDLITATVYGDPVRSSVPFGVSTELICRALGLPSIDEAMAGVGRALGEDFVDRFADALRAAASRLAPTATPVLPLVAAALGVPMAPTSESDQIEERFRERRAREAVADLLEGALAGPTLLIAEDVQWFDEMTRQTLASLAHRASNRPWLIVGTKREPGEPLIESARQLDIGPLDADEAAALVRAAEAAPGAAGSLRRILDTAGGNPLFLLEIVGSGLNQGDSLPDSIESVVATQLDQLRPDDRHVVRLAAVLGAAFEIDHLVRLLEGHDEPVSIPWSRLERFLQPIGDADGRAAFRHRIYRDVAYEGLSYRRRRELHATVAEHLSRDPSTPPSVLAVHWTNAQRWNEAWSTSRRAAEEALERCATEESANLYELALEAGRRLDPTPPDLGEVAEALGAAAELAGRPDLSDAAFRAAKEFLDDPARRALLSIRSARAIERTGKYPQALRIAQQVVKTSHEIPAASRALVTGPARALLAGLRYRQGRLRDSVDHAREALDDALSCADRATQARALFLLETCLTDLNDPEVKAVRGLALPVFEELGDMVGQADTLNNTGISAYYEGRWAEALDLYGRSLRLREQAGDLLGAAMARNNIGELLSDMGRAEEAEAEFESAIRSWRSAGYAIGIAVAISNLGRAMRRSGRPSEAHDLLDDAEARFTELGAHAFSAEVRARRCEVLLDEGRTVEAWDTSIGALDLAADAANHALVALIHRLRGEALVATNGLVRARQEFERSLDLARTSGATVEIAFALHALADLDEAGPDDERRQEADDLIRSLGVDVGIAVLR